MLNILPVPWLVRSLRRDLQVGALRVMLFALIVAVGAITAVGIFVDRVSRAMNEQASSLLGADVVLSSAEVLPETVIAKARRLDLHSVAALSFPSVVFNADRTLLVMVSAFGVGYPLKGQAKISMTPFGPAHLARGPPLAGTVWLSRQALERLGLKVGSQLHLGKATLRIAGIISRTPGTGTGLFDFAPHLIMSMADIPATELVTTQSRVRHELMLSGRSVSVHQLQHWLTVNAFEGIQVEDARSGQPALRTVLARAQRFLSLAALAAALLGGAAIAVTAASFARREANASALMRCFGASRALVLQLAICRLVAIGLMGSVVGLILGAVAQWGLTALLSGWFALSLPAPGWMPFGVGLGSGLILQMGFGLIPVLQVGRVPPLRVLRRELGSPPVAVWFTVLMALMAMEGLLWWQTGDGRLSVWVIGGGLATVVVLWGVARGLMMGVSHWKSLSKRFGLRFGLRNLGRRGALGAMQLAAVGLGLSTLLLLAFVRGDLLNAWQQSLPPDTPNQFAINIQTGQRTGLRTFFAAHDLPMPDFYPMVRARLMAINGHPVRARDYSDSQARHLIRREFNLSWARQPQAGNRIVAGQWWRSDQSRGFSVAIGLARRLHIHLGDHLTFDAAGVAFTGRVDSLRQVQWDTFRPNFFVVAVPGMLVGLPVAWITSFYLPANHVAFLPALMQAYPGITVFSVDQLVATVRAIIVRGVQAVEYVFAFSLVAGLIVLYAAIDASQAVRRRELAILRTLGASRHQVRVAWAAEFAGLGFMAGLIASFSASLLGYWLTTHIFKLEYHLDLKLWLSGLISGTLLVLIMGLWGTRQAIRVAPLAILQSPD